MNKIITLLTVLTALTGAAQAATYDTTNGTAHTEKVADIGVLAGYGTAGNNFDGFVWGATIGEKIVPNLGLDVYFSSLQKTTLGITTKMMPLVADLNIYFSDYPGFYIGPRAGIVFVNTDLIVGSVSNNYFGYGAQAGYDFALADSFSIGVNANWTHFSSTNLWNFVVPLKLWL